MADDHCHDYLAADDKNKHLSCAQLWHQKDCTEDKERTDETGEKHIGWYIRQPGNGVALIKQHVDCACSKEGNAKEDGIGEKA